MANGNWYFLAQYLRSPSNFSAVNINLNNSINTNRVRIPSETNDTMKDPPWIAMLKPNPKPPLARPALLHGLDVSFDRNHHYNPPAKDRGDTPKETVVFHYTQTRHCSSNLCQYIGWYSENTFVQNQIQDSREQAHAHQFGRHGCTNFQRHRNFADGDPFSLSTPLITTPHPLLPFSFHCRPKIL